MNKTENYGIGNREIKFRAWDIKREIFINPINDFHTFQWYQKSEVDKFVLMQYTELKDKNGTEIYEGDIVNCIQSIAPYRGKAIVSYCDVYCLYTLNSKPWWDSDGDIGSTMNKDSMFLHSWDYEQGDKIEVIGNIFENPELCK